MPHTVIETIKAEIRSNITSSPDKTKRFFKTGSGAYAEQDTFIGITVPHVRTIAQKFADLPLDTITLLLTSIINEERLLALIMLTNRYKKGSAQAKQEIFQFYKAHMLHVNNWNLVDSSAHLIMGAYLWDKERDELLALAQSPSMWERRIAMVATWYFIRKNDLTWTFKIAHLLLNDRQDLIHKAVGWMLREAGKKDHAQLREFLDAHAVHMPRTMLRYAIEKFSPEERNLYLGR